MSAAGVMRDGATRSRPHVDIAAFERRVILDAYLDASQAFWEKRARQLEAARPRRGDFTGNATPAEVARQWDRLTECATACRHRAHFLDADQCEIDAILGEVSPSERLADELALAERALRHAIDQGDVRAMAELERVIDELAPPRQVAA